MYKYLTLLTLLYCNTVLAQAYKYSRIDIAADTNHAKIFISTTSWGILNGSLYFNATDRVCGDEPWITDGTQAGTRRIKNVAFDAAGAYPEYFIPYNSLMYFFATDQVNGMELWRTDTTETGTYMVHDIGAPPSIVSGYKYIQTHAIYNGKLYFNAANTSINGKELWVTDGTSGGTKMVANPTPTNREETDPKNLTVLNGKLYFTGKDEDSATNIIYETDGTQSGTRRINIGNNISAKTNYITTYKGKLYYMLPGNKLIATDGTIAGTSVIKQINTNPNAAPISDVPYFEYNGKLYFNAYDGTNGVELWYTDGTAAGTQMLKDILPGSSSGYPRNFTMSNNKMYFIANDSVHGYELWVSDGTPSGTMMVNDILPGTASSNPVSLINCNDLLYCIAYNGASRQLYVTDGTATGTKLLAPPGATYNNPFPELCMYAPNALVVFDSALFFFARYDTAGVELWSVRDTTVDTSTSIRPAHNTAPQLTVDIYPNPARTYLSVKTNEYFKQGRVIITDMAGRTVQKAIMQHGTETQITLNNIAPGMYMADVWMDERRTTKRLVIQ